MNKIVGAILAGGQSRRFGSDKALASYAGQTLIEHVIIHLRLHCAAVVVCGRPIASLEQDKAPSSETVILANAGTHLLHDPEMGPRVRGDDSSIAHHQNLDEGQVAAIPDRPAPHLGPLGGLNAALHYAWSHGFTHVLSAGCDTPRLPPDLLLQLTAPYPTFVRDLPITGLWPVALAEPLDRHLAANGDRSIGRWARRVGAKPIDLAETVPNINTRCDLRELIAEYNVGRRDRQTDP